jgi:hypothetical protein
MPAIGHGRAIDERGAGHEVRRYLEGAIRRIGGRNEASAARILEAYSKWTPPADATFHQFLMRADGEGGFAVVEGDDQAAMALSIFKLSPYLEYAIYPVLDIEPAIGLYAEAIEFRNSIT